MAKRKTERRARLYLAYGSNLNVRAMASRCPGATLRGWLILDDARLVFRGCADVEYERGCQTPCGIWEITADDEERLDRYEGVRFGYYRKVVLDIGRGERALIYLMNDSGISPPHEGYLESIREGYEDFGFDVRYLDEALLHAWNNKRHSERTLERRSRPGHRFATLPERVHMERLLEREV